jgi:hypothetical protein
VPASSDEPAAKSVSSEPDQSNVDFADDEDPLLLQHETFVDEVDVAHDDESDSIDNAEIAPSAESEEEPPKRRRRRGRKRKRRDSASTNGTGKRTKEVAADAGTAEENVVSDEAGDAVQPSGELTDTEKPGDNQLDVDERAPRKRRRGRRRRGGKRGETTADDAATAEETSETTGKVGSEATSSSEGELYDDDDLSEEDDYDTGEKQKVATETRHRKIPTWSDAIGSIVDSNLTSRSKNPNSSRRGRGGRGRGRQGDRSNS